MKCAQKQIRPQDGLWCNYDPDPCARSELYVNAPEMYGMWTEMFDVCTMGPETLWVETEG